MTTKYLMRICFFVVSITGFSQDNNNSIESQFIKIVDQSNSFQEFKVIKKTRMRALQTNVLDSIGALKSQITTSQVEIEKQNSELELLTQNLNTTKLDLVASIEKESGIEVLGMLTKKSTYNTIIWSIILGLLVLLGIIFYKYKSSHEITKGTKLKLTEVETDFDAHRRKTLENEQLLRRKLQDEINKNRNV